MKRLAFFFGLLLVLLAPFSGARAALQAVGPVTAPGGFPLWYEDTDGLQLELCLDAAWCFFDPVDPNDPNQVALGIGGEVFWWMGEAIAPVTGVANGNALLVLAMEGTFGGAESVVNGNQISFGRVRIRVDVPVDGTYLVRYPYGEIQFDNVSAIDGINYTADVGAANFLNPELGFVGALSSGIGPFLTWPDYQNDASLQVPVLDAGGIPTGEIIQYVGNLNIPHQVVGSPVVDPSHATGFRNYFEVVRLVPGQPEERIAYTDLFGVMGRVYGGQAAIAHTYPAPPTPNLAQVGPINRAAAFAPPSAVDSEPLFAADAQDLDGDGDTGEKFVDAGNGTALGYPVGYPVWYEDGTGLRLTICQGGNPMCISDPVDPADPAQQALVTGGETFWWSADAFINDRSVTDDPTLVGNVPAGLDALLVLGVEGTFGGDESVTDGNQMAFARVRIRVDTPVAGDYTIVYPYGQKTFTNVPAGIKAINFTADIGIVDPADPDFAMVGTLFGEIGPNYLTWDTFDPTLAANDPLLVKQEPAIDAAGNPVLDGGGQPVMNTVHYVGDPAIGHTVTGSTFVYNGEPAPANYFRVIGPNGIDVRTGQFNLSGRVFDPASFRVFQLATIPVANNDTAQTIATTPVTIDVLANDSLAGAPVGAGATASLVSQAGNGTAVLNPDQTFTYTADPGFDGTDTFTYNVTANGETSTTPGTVTVTVLPAEQVDVNRALFDSRRSRWIIRGSGNTTAEGAVLTVRLNSPTGTVIGTRRVLDGRWRIRATSRTAVTTTPEIYVESGQTGTVYGPFSVRVR
ncbi:MAG: hypothetical protein Kow00100_12150 [Geothermobacteraceae bacterium]